MEVLIVIFFEKYIDVNRVKFRRVSKQAISLILLFSSEPGQQASDLGIIEAKKWPGWRLARKTVYRYKSNSQILEKSGEFRGEITIYSSIDISKNNFERKGEVYYQL